MDAALLSRIQFGFTVGFHYLFPPVTIGLSLVMLALEALHLRTGRELYLRAARFWTRLFALVFAMGVATGVVMEFQFGTNWARYSRFVGEIFGGVLIGEGVLAFFLESTFLGLLVFGWERLSPRMHLFSTAMVAFGAHLSAFWIVVTNSWLQTPAGFQIVGEGLQARARLVDYGAAVFNPSTLERYTHVISGCWLSGAFLVLSICAYYILKGRHLDVAKASMKAALALALAAAVGQLATGHASAVGVARHQPAKLAAFEGHFADSAPGTLYLFGWADADRERVTGLGIPKLLSLLAAFRLDQPLPGLRAFPRDQWPPVNPVFQAYHAMVGIGLALIGLALAGVFFWRRGSLFEQGWLMLLFLPSFLGPLLANELGWFSAEVGRQPWTVYGILRTGDSVSRVISAGEVLFSLALFGLIYALLLAVFLRLALKKIRQGPEAAAA
jgi:cytochrome d ubiquinol oxidase subunit I